MRKSLLVVLPCVLGLTAPVQAQSLPQAVQQALEVHPEVRSGVNGRLAADFQLKAARGAYWPKVDLFAGYGREGSDEPGTRRGDDHWTSLTRSESSLRIQQLVFDGFATDNEVQRRKATVDAQAHALLATSERTALQVVEAYLDVLRREELVRIAKDNVRAHQRVYDQIRLRSERGVGSASDRDQADARLAQARNNLTTEQTNLEDARVRFFSLVGRPPQELTLPPGLPGHLPPSLEQARLRMIDNNPLLRAADADIRAAESLYEAARAPFYPQLNIELSRSADNNLDGQRGHVNEWQAMLRMRYSLLAGGSDRAEREARSYQVAQAWDVRINTLRLLSEDLGLAWNALHNAREQKAVAYDYVRYSERVKEAYQKQFSLGDRTLLDLLDNENELFAAQRRLVDLTYTELYSQYRIKAAEGELLQSLGVVPPMEAVALSRPALRRDDLLPSLN